MINEVKKCLVASQVEYDNKATLDDLINLLKTSAKVDWVLISSYQRLSENFIREFQDKVYWPSISNKQKLSESFIREFQDKVYWPYISHKQKLSEEFREEFNYQLTSF